MPRLGAALLLALGSVAFANPASACSLPGLEPHVAVSSTGDTTPPGELETLSHSLARSGGEDQASSCSDLAILTLTVEPPIEELKPGEQFGYLLEVVDGEPPDGLVVPDTPVRASEGSLAFAWPDDSSGGHGVVAFTIAVSAVDPAGNTGPPSEIRIYDGGDSEGCALSASPAAGSSSVSLVLVLALFAVTARRARRKL